MDKEKENIFSLPMGSSDVLPFIGCSVSQEKHAMK